MPTWDSSQYLRFAEERTLPATDLAARVALSAPTRIIDLGCGPGNSTGVLAERWPGAELTGLDSSPSMLTVARRDFPQLKWQAGDIATWESDQPYDLIYANAAFQWVPNHGVLLPHLISFVAPAGALAFQVPANHDAPPHRLMRELAASRRWAGKFATPPRECRSKQRSFITMCFPPQRPESTCGSRLTFMSCPRLPRSWNGTAARDCARGWRRFPATRSATTLSQTTRRRFPKRIHLVLTGGCCFLFGDSSSLPIGKRTSEHLA